MIDYFHPGASVVVIAHGDPFTGQVGTVTATFNDAGDMIHVVKFGEAFHESAHYYASELTDARTAHMNYKEA
jgi:hypothetical protein